MGIIIMRNMRYYPYLQTLIFMLLLKLATETFPNSMLNNFVATKLAMTPKGDGGSLCSGAISLWSRRS